MRRDVLAGLAASLLVFLAGCSGVTREVPQRDEEGRYVIHMTGDNRFDPRHSKVPLGATIVFLVDGGVHDVDVHRPNDDFSAYNSGGYNTMPPGATFNVTLDQKGTWTVWCHTHHDEDMRASIRVQ